MGSKESDTTEQLAHTEAQGERKLSGAVRKGKVKEKVVQSCPTLCSPMDDTAHGILQARILEWVAFPFSKGSFQPKDLTQVSDELTYKTEVASQI